jgi:hypothetical protein
MARIKAVLNERRLAYEGAFKLAEHQMAAAKGRVVDEADQRLWSSTARSKRRNDLKRGSIVHSDEI